MFECGAIIMERFSREVEHFYVSNNEIINDNVIIEDDSIAEDGSQIVCGLIELFCKYDCQCTFSCSDCNYNRECTYVAVESEQF